MHPIKNATTGTLLQDHVQNESPLPEFYSNILVTLINSFTRENSHEDHIDNK